MKTENRPGEPGWLRKYRQRRYAAALLGRGADQKTVRDQVMDRYGVGMSTAYRIIHEAEGLSL